MTSRKQLEEQLEPFLRAQRLEGVNLLAGGVLHDFNNVLTAIMGQSALLCQDVRLEPEHRQASREILEAAHRASGLARQLLAYSRPHVREPEPLDLNAVIVDMGRLLRRVLGERVDLRKHLAPDLRPARLDRSEVEQVIVSLALNARDAMPDGGTLRIETANASGGPEGPGAVELVVRDSGEGMDEETLHRAFEPFFTTRARGEGVGLGLATVKHVVEASGGEISLESEPGEGTACRILFPAVEPAERAEEVTGPEALPGGSETVLVVEDEALVRSTVVRVLGRYGYRVLEAAGGDEALRRLDEHPEPVDLLITDVVMPHMSGTELARRMQEQSPRTRVFFISGYSDDPTIRDGVGDTELLPKPFPMEVLLRKVRQVLDAPG